MVYFHRCLFVKNYILHYTKLTIFVIRIGILQIMKVIITGAGIAGMLAKRVRISSFVTFGFNNKSFCFDTLVLIILQLPCKLHHPGPIVKIGQGRIEILWQTCSFGINNQNHNLWKFRRKTI